MSLTKASGIQQSIQQGKPLLKVQHSLGRVKTQGKLNKQENPLQNVLGYSMPSFLCAGRDTDVPMRPPARNVLTQHKTSSNLANGLSQSVLPFREVPEGGNCMPVCFSYLN